MSQDQEDWSDSEDESTQDEKSPVDLGVPSDPIESVEDLQDPQVSRIGGIPVRPLDSEHCISFLIRFRSKIYLDSQKPGIHVYTSKS